MKDIKMQNLRIGDVVKHVPDSEEPHNEMTVINKTEKTMTFFRPYVSLSDFIHTGGAIPYIGIEKFESPIFQDRDYLLVGNIYRGK